MRWNYYYFFFIYLILSVLFYSFNYCNDIILRKYLFLVKFLIIKYGTLRKIPREKAINCSLVFNSSLLYFSFRKILNQNHESSGTEAELKIYGASLWVLVYLILTHFDENLM